MTFHEPRTKSVAIIAIVVALCGLFAWEVVEVTPNDQRVYEPSAKVDLQAHFNEHREELDVSLINSCFGEWFDQYVSNRIIGVTLNLRDTESFGPWAARAEYGTADASEDGSLTEWADHYYITHDWSDFGKQILTMQPGDKATINGRTITVKEVCNYPKDSFYEEVLHIAGEDAIVLQTCYPDSDENRIVYGQ